MTNEERLINLESKVDRIIEAISPQATQESDANAEILAEIRKLRNEQKMTTALSFDEQDEFTDEDITFNKRRNIFMALALVVSCGFTVAMWLFYLPLFTLAFILFLIFGLQAVILVLDEYNLPGNTIKRISKNAVASAIFILAVTLVVSTGAQIGNSLITERSRGEEYRPPAIEQRYDNGRGDKEE
jgi:hypothetical protein